MNQDEPELDPRSTAANVLLDGPGAVAVLDVINDQVRMQWVNRGFERLTGYGLDEARRGMLTAPGPGSVVRAQLVEHARRILGEQFTRTETFILTLPLTRPDGRSVVMRAEFTPQSVSGGVRFVGVQVGGAHPAGTFVEDTVGSDVMALVADALADEDEPHLLPAIARVLQEHLFAWCGFFAEDGVLTSIESLDGVGSARSIRPRRGVTASDDADPVGRLLRASKVETARVALDAVHVPGSWSEQIATFARDGIAQVPNAGVDVVLAPLLGRGRVLGLIAVVEGSDRPRHPEAGEVFEKVARRVGLAMDHRLLYEAEHVLAETLQRAMLPELDPIDTLDVWTYYSPNAEHAQVGGDWYDVVRTPEGAVAAVVGDVVGHDMEAASAMGQLRSVLRALATEVTEPGEVLTRVDSIVASMRLPRAASMVYTRLTPAPDGQWALAYSRAGHLPGLLLSDGHVDELSQAAGTLVGFGDGRRESATHVVQPGDVLILYTDGLIERRSTPVHEGVVQLREVCAQIDADQDAAGVGEHLLRVFNEPPEDDVAVVVIRVPTQVDDRGGTGRQHRWRLPVSAESVGVARRRTAQVCRLWGYAETSALELVVSELVANAVVHGWGWLEVRVQERPDGVRVEVEDGNPMPPTRLDVHAARVGGFGMHIVERLADWGWRPSGPGKVVWVRLRGDLTVAEETPDGEG